MTNRLLPVAVKTVKIEPDDDEINDDESSKSIAKQQIDALRIELNTMAYIQLLNERAHPNLVRLIGATTTNKNELYLMTEYCEYGSLETYLQEKYKNKLFIDQIVQNNQEKMIWKVQLFIYFYLSCMCVLDFSVLSKATWITILKTFDG